jgi:hypothetical protein
MRGSVIRFSNFVGDARLQSLAQYQQKQKGRLID